MQGVSEGMVIANLVVGLVTPQLQKELEVNLSGSVRQICVSPRLFLVQIPRQWATNPSHSDEVSDTLIDWETLEDGIEVGTLDGQGYLRLKATGWMCEYRQHPTDLTQTALRSLQEPTIEKKRPIPIYDKEGYMRRLSEQGAALRQIDEEAISRRFDHMISSAIHEEELSAYDKYIWTIAQDPSTFSGDEERRRALQAWIIMGSYDNPAVRETVVAEQSEMKDLDAEEEAEWIGDIVNEVIGEAEVLVFSLSYVELEAIARFELEHRLRALRENMLTEHEVEMALSSFGEYALMEARPDVERLLTHPAAAIRRRALETLVMAWSLFEYTEVAFSFLLDPDSECRRQGMRCLHPTSGTVVEDPRTLTAYARIAANREETQDMRLTAYCELLMAIGYEIDHDNRKEMEWFLEGGGSLEHAPWVDWNLVSFFLKETSEECTFHATLSFHSYGGWTEWVDQHGRVFYTTDELGREVLLPAHRIIRTRLPDYQMTISVSHLPPKPLRTWEDTSYPATPPSS